MVRCGWLATTLVAALAGAATAGDPPPEPDGLPGPTAKERVDALEKDVDRLKRQLAEAGTPEQGHPILDLVRSVRVKGFVNSVYTWNLAEPDRRKGANRYRLVDPDHNTFGIPYAALALQRDVNRLNELDLGFKLELAAGRLVEEGLRNDGLFDSGPLDLAQAYVDLQVPLPIGSPLLVRMGRQHALLGKETIDLSRNAFVSLSPLATFGPKTLTGLSLGLDLGAGFRYTQWVGNGWDQVVDRNDAKTLGGQLVWELEGERLDFSLGWLAGAEREDSEGDKRVAVQLDLGWSPWSGADLRAAAQLGQEEGGARDGGFARWYGASAQFRQGFFAVEDGRWHHLAVGVRGSYFKDEGGARTGADQALSELSAVVEVRPLELAALRFEYRHDESSEDVFLGRGLSRADAQDTFSAELRFEF